MTNGQSQPGYGYQQDADQSFSFRVGTIEEGKEYEVHVDRAFNNQGRYGNSANFEVTINPVKDPANRWNHKFYIPIKYEADGQMARLTKCLFGDEQLKKGIDSKMFAGLSFRGKFRLAINPQTNKRSFPLDEVRLEAKGDWVRLRA